MHDEAFRILYFAKVSKENLDILKIFRTSCAALMYLSNLTEGTIVHMQEQIICVFTQLAEKYHRVSLCTVYFTVTMTSSEGFCITQGCQVFPCPYLVTLKFWRIPKLKFLLKGDLFQTVD